MITYKSEREIALMKEAGHIAMLAHEEIRKAIKPGVSTKELDKIDKDINSKDAKQKIVELVGKDNATPIIEKWDSMDAPDKNTKLSGKDQATAIVTLWNAMSANDKFSSLSAEDKATALVSIWNGLTAEQKTAIINGDCSAADKAISKVNAQKIKDKSFSINANDNASGTVRSIKGEIDSVHGKTVTITTEHVNVVRTKSYGTKAYKSGGSQRFSSNGHKSHQFNGTFHPSVPAKAQGTLNSSSVGIPKSEKTLINEVGTEGVVRDGKLNIYNNGYPALVDLHRGDIVFNHFFKKCLYLVTGVRKFYLIAGTKDIFVSTLKLYILQRRYEIKSNVNVTKVEKNI